MNNINVKCFEKLYFSKKEFKFGLFLILATFLIVFFFSQLFRTVCITYVAAGMETMPFGTSLKTRYILVFGVLLLDHRYLKTNIKCLLAGVFHHTHFVLSKQNINKKRNPHYSKETEWQGYTNIPTFSYRGKAPRRHDKWVNFFSFVACLVVVKKKQ